MLWPARPRGWVKRTGYSGGKRQLEEVDPGLGRGTGWPGSPVGRRPGGIRAADTQLGVRATREERAEWQRAADDTGRKLAEWARDELNAAAARPRSKSKP